MTDEHHTEVSALRAELARITAERDEARAENEALKAENERQRVTWVEMWDDRALVIRERDALRKAAQ